MKVLSLEDPMSSPTVVLDAIAGINVPKELLGQLANAPNSLYRLAAGLGFLYGKVRHAELTLIDQVRDSVVETLDRLGKGVSQEALDSCNSGGVEVFVYGIDPLLNSVRQDLIECAFHWYSVSADNFVRVIWSLRTCLQSAFCSLRDMRLIMARWIMASLVSGLRS